MPSRDLGYQVLLKPAEVAVDLSADQIDRLNNLTPAAGERHNKESMATIDR